MQISLIGWEFPIVIAWISLDSIIWRKEQIKGIKIVLWKFLSNNSLNILEDFLAHFWCSTRDWERFLLEKKVFFTAVVNVVVFIISIVDVEWWSFRTASHGCFDATPLWLLVLVAWIHYTVNSLVWEEKVIESSEIQI